MSRDAVGQLELFGLADPVEYADVPCFCTHYGIEHRRTDMAGRCLALDLFGDVCDCPGYEPHPDYEDTEC